jgi:hypothetical protein
LIEPFFANSVTPTDHRANPQSIRISADIFGNTAAPYRDANVTRAHTTASTFAQDSNDGVADSIPPVLRSVTRNTVITGVIQHPVLLFVGRVVFLITTTSPDRETVKKAERARRSVAHRLARQCASTAAVRSSSRRCAFGGLAAEPRFITVSKIPPSVISGQ